MLEKNVIPMTPIYPTISSVMPTVPQLQNVEITFSSKQQMQQDILNHAIQLSQVPSQVLKPVHHHVSWHQNAEITFSSKPQTQQDIPNHVIQQFQVPSPMLKLVHHHVS